MAVALEDVVRHVGEADLPWVDATGGVWLQVLRVDRAAGVWVVRNRFEPGVRLQPHRHAHATGHAHTTGAHGATRRSVGAGLPTAGLVPGSGWEL